jgi:hypothetical protein
MSGILLTLALGNPNLIPALPLIAFCALFLAGQAALGWTERPQ